MVLRKQKASATARDVRLTLANEHPFWASAARCLPSLLVVVFVQQHQGTRRKSQVLDDAEYRQIDILGVIDEEEESASWMGAGRMAIVPRIGLPVKRAAECSAAEDQS